MKRPNKILARIARCNEGEIYYKKQMWADIKRLTVYVKALEADNKRLGLLAKRKDERLEALENNLKLFAPGKPQLEIKDIQ